MADGNEIPVDQVAQAGGGAAAQVQNPANPAVAGAGARTLEEVLALSMDDFPSMAEVEALAADLKRLAVNPFDAGVDKVKFRTLLFAAISSAEDLQADGGVIPEGVARTLNRLAANVGELKLNSLIAGGKHTQANSAKPALEASDLARLSKRAKPFALVAQAGNFNESMADPDMAPALVPTSGTQQADLAPDAATLFARMVWVPADVSSSDTSTFLQTQMAELVDCPNDTMRLLLALRIFQRHIPSLVPEAHRQDCAEFWKGLETLSLNVFGRGGTLPHAISSVEDLLAALRQRMLGTYRATPEQERTGLASLLHQSEGANIWLHQECARDIWSPSVYDSGARDSPWGAIMLSPRAQRLATKALVEASASASKPGRNAMSTPNASASARQLMISCNLPPGWVREVHKYWCPLDVALPGACPGAKSGACHCKHMESPQDAKLLLAAVAKANVLHPQQWFAYLSALEATMPYLHALRAAVAAACSASGKPGTPHTQ